MPVTPNSGNTTESVELNTPYRMAAILEAPLAVGDRTAANNKPKLVRVGGLLAAVQQSSKVPPLCQIQ